MQTKCCSVCKQEKPCSEFYTDKRSKSGFSSRCKVCGRKATAACRAKNPDKARAASLAYYRANKELMGAYAKQYFADNPDRVKFYRRNSADYVRCWRERNKERLAPLNKEAAFMRRFSTHNLTLDQYHAIAERQDFVCAICGEQPDCQAANTSNDGFVIDHCHSTGKVRGLVCSNCNVGIGMLKDSAVVAASASRYLSLHVA